MGVGGTIGGGALTIGSNTDDFLVNYIVNPTFLAGVSWSLASEPSIIAKSFDFSGSIEITQAPEPGTLALLGLGLLGVGCSSSLSLVAF